MDIAKIFKILVHSSFTFISTLNVTAFYKWWSTFRYNSGEEFAKLFSVCTLREERKLRVFENMVLRRIFGPRRDEVTGEWRRLHKGELNDLYCSPNIVQVIKWRRMR